MKVMFHCRFYPGMVCNFHWPKQEGCHRLKLWLVDRTKEPIPSEAKLANAFELEIVDIQDEKMGHALMNYQLLASKLTDVVDI